MADAFPLFFEALVVVAGGLEPKRDAAFLFPSVGEFFHFGGQEYESGRRRRSNFVHDDPEVTHDFLKRRAEGNRVALTQSFDLDSELASCILAVSDDVDATSVSSGGHDIPPQQREVVASVVKAGVAGELRIKRHIERPNVEVSRNQQRPQNDE